MTGNGKSCLERLILDDQRTVCMARFYLRQWAPQLWKVPKAGECVQLVELGTHCRGAVFLDGNWVKTEALEAAIDRISQTYTGFCFGRYDIRTPCVEAYQVLFDQWRIAFEIGAQNRQRSTRPTPLLTLAGLILEFKCRPRLNTT